MSNNGNIVSLAEYKQTKEEQGNSLSPECELSVEEVQKQLIKTLERGNEFLEQSLEKEREFSDKVAQDWEELLDKQIEISNREKEKYEQIIAQKDLKIEALRGGEE